MQHLEIEFEALTLEQALGQVRDILAGERTPAARAHSAEIVALFPAPGCARRGKSYPIPKPR